MEQKKLIRFIDSNSQDLFYLPDGDNIILTRRDGHQVVSPCEYIDPTHLMVGSRFYHIMEFATDMENMGTEYAPEQAPKLPDHCVSIEPATGAIISIEKGKPGYEPCGFSSGDPVRNRRMVYEYNRSLRVVPQQEAAMLGGALHGWRTKAAKPSSYDVRGQPVAKQKQRKKEKER